MSNDKKATVGSGNVFADLGFANPEEELLKAKLIREIRSIIKRRKLTQAKAAILLGPKRPTCLPLLPAVSESSHWTAWFAALIGWITRWTWWCATSRAGRRVPSQPDVMVCSAPSCHPPALARSCRRSA